MQLGGSISETCITMVVLVKYRVTLGFVVIVQDCTALGAADALQCR